MTNPNSSKAPTGWYPNPDDETQDRLWDGEGWTNRTRPRETPAPPAVKERAPRFVIAVVGFWLALAGLVLSPAGPIVGLNIGLLLAGLVLGIIAVTRHGRPKTMAIWAICLAGLGLIVAPSAAAGELGADSTGSTSSAVHARQAIIKQVAADVKKQAQKDVVDGTITGPVLNVPVDCTPTGGSYTNLAFKSTAFACFVSTKKESGGEYQGYNFAARVNWTTGQYTYNLQPSDTN
jgi:hypothetical protein